MWVGFGLGFALLHLLLLCGVALFDDGQLAGDWVETLPWLAIVAMPAVIAAVGLHNASALPWAAGISLPLSLLSIAGATLPLILPAIFYLLAYGAAARPTEEIR
jgi:hypothetical protein